MLTKISAASIIRLLTFLRKETPRDRAFVAVIAYTLTAQPLLGTIIGACAIFKVFLDHAFHKILPYNFP